MRVSLVAPVSLVAKNGKLISLCYSHLQCSTVRDSEIDSIRDHKRENITLNSLSWRMFNIIQLLCICIASYSSAYRNFFWNRRVPCFLSSRKKRDSVSVEFIFQWMREKCERGFPRTYWQKMSLATNREMKFEWTVVKANLKSNVPI